MVKKYAKVIFNALNKINKKIFFLAFFAVAFCFFASFISFQGTEEVKISVQVAEAEEEEAEDPCEGNTTCGECGNCDNPGCGGCPDKFRVTGGYKQQKNCWCNVGCCSSSCNCGSWYYLEWC